jgi:glycosyltransferase involved in cell wall biosynthesis/2-polyprenyl-3-methyl-5-hydroxy-6-metoxy-1,4-benzoquinol methylase
MNGYDIELDRKTRVPLNLILSQIKPNSTVLEFGPANGRMTQVMKEELGCKVYIVELDQELFGKAIEYAEDGICSDIMKFEWVEYFREIKFDYVIYADVLEHLTNPELVIKKAGDLLCDTGTVFISIPNLAHNDVILSLLMNKFNYSDTGLLDKTHVHFFTYNSAVAMFEKLGYKVEYENYICRNTLNTEIKIQIDDISPDIGKYVLDRKEGEVYQFVFGISKADKKCDPIKMDLEDAIYVIRTIYFDLGEGFQKDFIKFENLKKDSAFSIKADVLPGTKTLRFDPAPKCPCRIKNFKAYSNLGEIFITSMNGTTEDNEFIFSHFDAQIYFTELQDVQWVSFTGNIEYDLELAFDTTEKKLISNIQLLEEQNHTLEKDVLLLNDELKEYKEKILEMHDILLEKEKDISVMQNNLIEKENDISEMQNILISNKLEMEAAFSQNNVNIDYIKQFEVEKKKYEDMIIYLEDEKRSINDMLNNLYASKSWRYTNVLRKMYRNMKTRITKGDVRMIMESNSETVDTNQAFLDLTWSGEVEIDKEDTPLVSIIVPNYNHSAYLRERLDSIYNQTYANYEVILLDDCSSDSSREILCEYAEKHSKNTITIFNEANCGKVFKQWNRGIKAAKGKYIWIAESDDYSAKDFLEKMVPLLAKESVMLAFSRSVFMQDGKEIWNTEEYLSDLAELKWDRPFTMTAKLIVEKGFSIKNIIPNVSSTVFRNVGILSEELQNIWGNMKLSGDWIFYLNMIKGGCISYTNETTNFYRVHSQSTSLKVQQTMDYYKEYEEVSMYIASNYIVPRENYALILHNLKEHYKAIHQTAEAEEVNNYYDIDLILSQGKKRKKNVIIACFALCSGGGETYPLYLANEMKRQGISVTVLDFRMQKYDENIRRILNPTVPLVEVESFDYFYRIVSQLGCEIIHSHHASIDEAISVWLDNSDLSCKHIITLHGMYETMDAENKQHLLDSVTKTCKHFVYIADKNLLPFKEYNCYSEDKFTKLPNGMPAMETHAIDRKELGIEEKDFVLCLVSRGIAEKGWQEAILATKMANRLSERKIHLLLIGDGEIRGKLEANAPDYIHFLGVKNNVRDYFAMSDAGILPTTFKGESYPLVVIESLMSGKPVIATDIAEVKNQITDDEGNMAGVLLHMDDWKLDINEICNAILNLSGNEEVYHQLQGNTYAASQKFNIEKVVGQYLNVYNS